MLATITRKKLANEGTTLFAARVDGVVRAVQHDVCGVGGKARIALRPQSVRQKEPLSLVKIQPRFERDSRAVHNC